MHQDYQVNVSRIKMDKIEVARIKFKSHDLSGLKEGDVINPGVKVYQARVHDLICIDTETGELITLDRKTSARIDGEESYLPREYIFEGFSDSLLDFLEESVGSIILMDSEPYGLLNKVTVEDTGELVVDIDGGLGINQYLVIFSDQGYGELCITDSMEIS